LGGSDSVQRNAAESGSELPRSTPIVTLRYYPPMQIDNVSDRDLDAVFELNEASVPHVNSVSREQMRWFADHAPYFRVARDATRISGFLIGMRPGLNYDSPNYQWFSRHYDDFGYIDRVAVDRSARRSGVASALYDDFRTFMSRDVDVLTCEVNLRPPNETSMRFHERQGFRVVARQQTEGGSKEVALMEKKL